MPAIRRAENRSATRHNSARATPIEQHEPAGRQQSLEAIEEPENLVVQLLGGKSNATENGIESGTIATARQNTDARLHSLGATCD
jgi:hypothetical protein